MIRVFSKRFESALFKTKTIKFSVPRRVRKRLWMLMDERNHALYIQRDPHNNWTDDSDVACEVERELKKVYGVDRLEAFVEDDTRGPVSLQGFVERGYPSQVFDAVEVFCFVLDDQLAVAFQSEVNSVAGDEKFEWRLTDGQWYRIDSSFLREQVLNRALELTRASGFEGAYEEFREAQNDLLAGNHKGAIHNACKAFESTLKSLEQRSDGNASVLIRQLADCGVYDDLPEDFGKAFGSQVLMSLPFMRNRLAGHGQGHVVVDVPHSYSQLAVNLCGALLVFLISRHNEVMSPEPTPAAGIAAAPADDGIPF